MVVFIHRQEKYGLIEFEDGSSTKGVAEIILSKNRNGPVGDVRLRFREEKAQFVELDEFELDEITETASARSQSYTVGSKMNNDDLNKKYGSVNIDPGDYEEPPFG